MTALSRFFPHSQRNDNKHFRPIAIRSELNRQRALAITPFAQQPHRIPPGSNRTRTKRFLDAPAGTQSEDASIHWVEVIDPHHPLFGKKLELHSISRSHSAESLVFLRRGDGSVTQVPRKATSLSRLDRLVPIATIILPAVEEFITLVKEYGLWMKVQERAVRTSGRRSTNKRKKQS